ncbi:DUF3592 domain-containing protein [Candidatus Laterigemmans baculatus]|uniref:DUF3592 domain-containing protein n=1 Tax=Candidatus Laterigemmans baculatus TaxID=2770505 RepID=UPI0013DB443C|nr:DUF3592 domain-containing protein [Candidatus Laterigemmans baculatus]
MLRNLRSFLSIGVPLPNLEEVLQNVRAGKLSVDEAAEQIRDDATRAYLPPWSLRLLRFAGSFFALVGMGLAIYSVSVGFGKTATRGTVVEMVGSGMTSPVVEYRVNGAVHRVHGSVSSSSPTYAIGDVVEVLYNPHNPTVAKINTFRERWLFPVVMVGAGLNAILLSFVLPWVFRLILGTHPSVRRILA